MFIAKLLVVITFDPIGVACGFNSRFFYKHLTTSWSAYELKIKRMYSELLSLGSFAYTFSKILRIEHG